MNDGHPESKVVEELSDGGEWFARVDQQVRSLLIEHPILSLACAVGVGYLAARLLDPANDGR